MKNQSILILQGPTSTEPTLHALADAARKDNLHLSVVHVGPIPPIPSYSYGAMPYGAMAVPDQWLTDRSDMTARLNEKQQATRDFLKKEDLSGDVAVICSDPVGLADIAVQRAFACDLAILDGDLRAEPDTFRALLYGLLFNAGAPVLLNLAKAAALHPKSVMIAWNNSLPATRAVHMALPMLRGATSVTVACFDPVMSTWADGADPGSDIARWLSHHGCKVTVQQVPSGGRNIGDAIVQRAGEVGADLVVMGAYGKSRLRETIFGGTTRAMTDQLTIPVLLAH